ncbi:hypothetical protein [[Clostridium] fimetarium]|uniref:Deacetylase PdaC domain-containing protein n=1 Tax=[Clostridium] fimetarium TaxID=99656 RepID=A0A1I0PPI5_9FIRM|nr:hypothetical protein [[Clostridium] fimetarium]SEW16299.1 hypothetical protein SAMN05421659_105238 [[Clostridium] fimetarium]
MKKVKITLVSTIVCINIITAICLVSCQNNESGNTFDNSTSSHDEVSSISYELRNVSVDYTINEEVFSDTSHINSNVNIKYPQLIGDKRDYSEVNNFIKETIMEHLYDYGVDYSNLTITVDFKITFSNKRLISIVFSGFGNVRTAAHPNNIFYSLNIDLEACSKIKLQDICSINSNLVKIYREKWAQQTDEVRAVILRDYNDDDLIKAFTQADNLGSSVYSYLTSNGVAFSLSVSHAIGDHIETEINYQEIKDNLKIKE